MLLETDPQVSRQGGALGPDPRMVVGAGLHPRPPALRKDGRGGGLPVAPRRERTKGQEVG